MPLVYAGAPLLCPSPDVTAWGRECLDPSWVSEWVLRTWPGRGLEALGWRGYAPPGPVEIGVLKWPAGASRWAQGHFLCHEETAAAIRAASYASSGGGGTWSPCLFEFTDDGGDTGFDTQLYCLPPRPLAFADVPQVPGAAPTDGLYLLTLVDERFLWWMRTGEVSVDEGTTDWADLYSSIASLLGGVTLNADAVDSAYLKPPSGVGVSYRSLPQLLDAVAASVGHRVVRDYDGQVYATSASNSLARHLANLAMETGTGPGFHNDRIAGYRCPSQAPLEWAGAVPDTVRLVCPKAVDGLFQDPPELHAVEVTLASLGLTEYQGVAGFDGAKTFHTTGVAGFTGAGTTPDNASEITALATRVATDYYLWQLGRADARYEGALGWDLKDAHAEEVHWEHTFLRVSTRVVRTPWSGGEAEDLAHLSGEAGTGPGSGIHCQALLVEPNSIQDYGVRSTLQVNVARGIHANYSFGVGENDPVGGSIFSIEGFPAERSWGVFTTTDQGLKGRKSFYDRLVVSSTDDPAYSDHRLAGGLWTKFAPMVVGCKVPASAFSGDHDMLGRLEFGSEGDAGFTGTAPVQPAAGVYSGVDSPAYKKSGTGARVAAWSGYASGTGTLFFFQTNTAGKMPYDTGGTGVGLEITASGTPFTRFVVLSGLYAINVSGTNYDGDSGTDALGNVFKGGICTDVGSGTISGTGTVTSVAATAPTAGFTISGSPITTSGTFAFALADDLAALEALTGTNTIYYRSAASTWTAVTIGSNLTFSGGTLSATGGGSGTVTSVALALPTATFDVTGSPVTGSGTLTGAYKTQAKNKLFAGPATGVDAAPTFRLQDVLDLPAFSGLTAADPALLDFLPLVDTSASSANKKAEVDYLLALAPSAPGGRLTPATGDPLDNGTTGTSLYYTPYLHNRVDLYDGTRWVTLSFSEVRVGGAVLSLTSGKNYDVFGFISSGALAVEQLVWTSDTARATAVTIQDGRYCKSGDKTRLYLGTFRAVSATQAQNDNTLRGVWNMYNRIPLVMYVTESANSWTVTSTTFQSYNSSTANRLQWVCGLPGVRVQATARANVETGAGDNGFAGLGLDSTSVNAAVTTLGGGQGLLPSIAEYDGYPGAGFHFMQMLQRSQTGAGATFFGDNGGAGGMQAGIMGTILG